MRLLVTRPQPDADVTAAALRVLGHEVLLAPMLRIETIIDADLGAGPWDAVAMTSANAARAIAVHRRLPELTGLPTFVVGRRTGDAARAAGFSRVESADADVAELGRRIARARQPGSLVLYLAADDRAGDLAEALTDTGHHVQTVVIYRAVAAARLPDHAAKAAADGRIDGVLHFSPRSAMALLAAAKSDGMMDKLLTYQHYCLSAPVAEPLRQAGAPLVSIAARPDEQSLFALIGPA